MRGRTLGSIHLALRYHGDVPSIPQPPVRVPPAMGDVDVGEGGSA